MDKVKVFIKQEVWDVDPLERWLDVSARIARKFGMPPCGLFKLEPSDGDFDVQTPQRGLENYAFDWKEKIQYWWRCEYDAFEDQHRQDGKQIVIMDEDGLAVFVNWGTAEIGRYISTVFAVHEHKNVVVTEIRENTYAWKIVGKQGAPPAVDFTIKLGSATFGTELEDGSENTMGEWPSRKIGQIIPTFEECQILGRTVTRQKEPVELWAGSLVVPTGREKEHTLVFHVAEKKFTRKVVRCTFPYDQAEIMNFRHTASDQIPEQSTLAEFPAPSWPGIVHVTVKGFRSVWK
jgi:hypothetical protein